MSREAIKHTPGPWNYDRSGYSLYVNSGRELVTALSMDGKRLETSEANARLIAAAPDLLEALKEATSALEWRWERVANRAAPVHETAIQEAYNQARAAIAKATGEKS